jgi:fibronectin-binding autotransporter adhesin
VKSIKILKSSRSPLTLALLMACGLICRGAFAQAEDLTWIGAVNGDWDGISMNWATNGSTTADRVFVTGDDVRFDDNGQALAVGLAAEVDPGVITVDSSLDYTFTNTLLGAIGGSASRVKSGSGTLTMGATSNTYTGPTVIKQGTLVLAGSGVSLGSGPITNSGTLLFSSAMVVSNTIAGTGNIIKSGGTVTFLGANSMNASNITLLSGTTQFGPGALGSSTNILLTGGSSRTTFEMLGAGSDIGLAVQMTINGVDAVNNLAQIICATNAMWNGHIHLQNCNLQFTGHNVAGAAGEIINGAIDGFTTNSIALAGGGTNNYFAAPVNTPGQSGLAKSQSGWWWISGTDSSYNRVAILGNGAGRLRLLNDNALATNSYFYLAGVNCGLDLLGHNQTFHGLSSTNDLVTVNNSIIGNGSADGTPARLTILPGVSPDLGTNMTYSGRIRNADTGGANTGSRLSLTVDVGAGGSLTLNGVGLAYTGDTTLKSGTLIFTGTAVHPANAAYVDLEDGTTLDVSGSSTPFLQVNNRLQGNGTFNIIGDLNLRPPSTTELKLNKSGSVLTNDMVNVTGLIQFNGTLQLDVTASPALTESDSFHLFNAAGGYSFGFTNIVPATPGSGLAWDTNTLATDGILRIMATAPVVNPNPTNLVTSVSGTNLTVSWPADHTGWRLQAQTNAGLSTNWVDVDGSTLTNQILLPIDPANGSVFLRMIYP